MTKRHFIALADMILEHNRVLECADDRFSRSQIRALATFCQQQNSRFNCERWFDYIAGTCGPNGGAVKKAVQP